MTKLKDTAIIKEVYTKDETKTFYQYEPGTESLDENYVGRTVYVKDFVFLDENFNKFIGNRNKNDIIGFYEELTKAGRNVIIGDHSPEIEDRYGDYVLNENPNTLGIWERPTKEELENYKSIIERQKEEEAKQVMKKKLA